MDLSACCLLTCPARQAFITAAAAASDPDWSSLGAPLSSSITAGVGLQEGSLLLYHATLSSTPDWFKVRQQHCVGGWVNEWVFPPCSAAPAAAAAAPVWAGVSARAHIIRAETHVKHLVPPQRKHTSATLACCHPKGACVCVCPAAGAACPP